MYLQLRKAVDGYISDIRCFFHEGWDQIAMANLTMLKRIEVFAIPFIAVQLMLSVLHHMPDHVIIAYSMGLACQVALGVTVYTRGDRFRWRPRLIQALSQFFIVTLMALVTYMATLGRADEPGILFAPFMLVLSMMMIRRLWQSYVLITAVVIVFLLGSYLSKSAVYFQQDLSLGVVTWILSLITNFELLNVRLRDYRLRSELVKLSCTDSLTGLLNKSTVERVARTYLERHSEVEYSALFVIDIDQFKMINDQLGHRAGDEALETFGNTLISLFRSQDLVGRVGGDEFVVLMKNIGDRKLIARRAAGVCDAVRKTRLTNFARPITCSIGIATCPKHGSTYDALFEKADEQLYQLKRSGKNGFLIAR